MRSVQVAVSAVRLGADHRARHSRLMRFTQHLRRMFTRLQRDRGERRQSTRLLAHFHQVLVLETAPNLHLPRSFKLIAEGI